MREKSICRRCESFVIGSFGSGRKTFLIPQATAHYAPDLPFKLETILIDVAVDPKSKTVRGKVTQKVKVIAPNQTRMKLDQVGLKIKEVIVAGKKSDFSVEGNSLLIPLAKSPSVGETIEFTVGYEVFNPRRGLYFTGPDADYPKKRYQVWAQGQDEDNRHWFPTFDYPNQKVLSEVIATVPRGFTAVSNGALISQKETSDGSQFHYKLGTPHVTYLITLTVAEFAKWEDQIRIPVQYFVEPGREEDGKRAFSNTPKMIQAYEKKIGVAYPYEKYSQVAVQDFIFGGMENTSATTQTDLTLHDARAHLDFSSDPLVSHELAHQWFGDLLTCRDWSNGWLNEGFATFMERVWIENNTDPDGGVEEAKYYQFQDMKDHLEEDRNSYRRPIVCNTYVEPIDLFDTHLYQKGGLVLNLLRATLGEDLFWKSIELYVNRHRGQNVETIDLIRAIEDATGKNLRRFFDEWIFSGGYPELELSYEWHEERKQAELVIEQKQTGGKPSVVENGVTTPLFHLSAVIEATLADGKKVSQTVQIGEIRERIFLALPSKPVMFRFDPQNTIPKTLKFPRSKELLIYQLSQDCDCMGRIEAAKELGKIVDHDVMAVLAKAVSSDIFWGVQVEVASVLADLRSSDARDALIAALGSKNPKARRGIVKALGTYKDEKASQALKKLASSDPSYFVEGEAIAAWASSMKNFEEAEKFLISQLTKESYRDVIRASTLHALSELQGIGRGERKAALDALMEWSKRGKSNDVRISAIMGLGTVARSAQPSIRHQVLTFLNEIADEDNFRTRVALVRALQSSESSDAVSILEKIRALDIDGRVKRSAMFAVDALATAGTTPESVENLKEALTKLEENYRKLKDRLELVEVKAK